MPDICVWNKCNNKCAMCTNPSDFSKGFGYRAKNIIRNLSNLKTYKPADTKDNYFLLTGGEPTINPELFLILAFFSKKFPESRLGILTNGRMFAYRDFSKKIFKCVNFDLAIPIHGFNAKSHDLVTRTPNSFRDVMLGLENIRFFKKGHVVEIRIILTKQTIKNLKKIVEFIADNVSWAQRLVFVFMEIEGQAEENFNIVGLKYSDVKNIKEAMRIAKKKFKDVRLYHFPLCTIPRELWTDAWRTLRSDEVAFVKKCGKCKYKKLCVGIHKNYLRIFGDGEFVPIKRTYALTLTNDFHHPII